jgi:hypothetical protein
MNHYSSLPVTLLGAPKRISPVTDQNPRSLANLPDFNEAQIRKNNRFFGQSKLTGAQAQPSWLPIYFGKAQVAHFHMKMLQNLLISARARPKKRRGGKKRGNLNEIPYRFRHCYLLFDIRGLMRPGHTNTLAFFIENYQLALTRQKHFSFEMQRKMPQKFISWIASFAKDPVTLLRLRTLSSNQYSVEMLKS